MENPWPNMDKSLRETPSNKAAQETQEVKGSEKGKKRVREGTSRKGKEKVIEKKEGEGTSDHDMHIWTERERRKKMRNMFSMLHALLPQLPPKADKTSIVDEAVNTIKRLQATVQRLQKRKLDRLHGGGVLTTPSSLNSFDILTCVAATTQLVMGSSRENFMADQVSSFNNTDIGNSSNNNNLTMARMMKTTSFQLPMTIQTWTSNNVVLNICGDVAQFLVYAPKKPGLFTSICGALEKHKMEVVYAHVSSDAYHCNYMIQARVAIGDSEELSEVITVEERFKQAGGEIMIWVSS